MIPRLALRVLISRVLVVVAGVMAGLLGQLAAVVLLSVGLAAQVALPVEEVLLSEDLAAQVALPVEEVLLSEDLAARVA